MTEDEKKLIEAIRKAGQFLCDKGYRDVATIPSITVVDLLCEYQNAGMMAAASIADEHSSSRFGHDNPVAVKFWHLGEDYAREEIAKSIRSLLSK